MNLIYFDPFPNKRLEEYLKNYNKLLEQSGEPTLKVERKETMDEVLNEADVSKLTKFNKVLCNMNKIFSDTDVSYLKNNEKQFV